jgi:hypothetical protein
MGSNDSAVKSPTISQGVDCPQLAHPIGDDATRQARPPLGRTLPDVTYSPANRRPSDPLVPLSTVRHATHRSLPNPPVRHHLAVNQVHDVLGCSTWDMSEAPMRDSSRMFKIHLWCGVAGPGKFPRGEGLLTPQDSMDDAELRRRSLQIPAQNGFQ